MWGITLAAILIGIVLAVDILLHDPEQEER